MNSDNPAPSILLPGHCPRCHEQGTKSLLLGRHCLTCGYTRPWSQEEQIRLGVLKPHDKPEPGDGQALISLIGKYSLVLPKNSSEWRVALTPEGRHPQGSHAQLFSSLTLLCTDGVVAFALLGDDETVVFIQLKAFIPREEDKPAMEHRKSPKSKSKKQLELERLAALD